MKRSLMFALLGFVILTMIVGLIAVGNKKNSAKNTETVSTPSVVITVEPSKSSSPEPTLDEETDDYEYNADLTNYKVHKLPDDIDTWSDEEWTWWVRAASDFREDYNNKFEKIFGDFPLEGVTDNMQDFGETVCSELDSGKNIDDIAAGIVDSGGSKQSQMAMAAAVEPAVKNFCPWNTKKLK